jgi:hypothetical protein
VRRDEQELRYRDAILRMELLEQHLVRMLEILAGIDNRERMIEILPLAPVRKPQRRLTAELKAGIRERYARGQTSYRIAQDLNLWITQVRREIQHILNELPGIERTVP